MRPGAARPAAVAGTEGARLAGAGPAAPAPPPPPRLEALEAREQRLDRGLVGGHGGLDERELELGAGVRAVLHRAQRGGDQVEQAHDVAGADALRLLAQPLVLLGRHGQLGRDLAAERLHDHQPARVRLEVAEEAPDVAARLGQPGRGEQRRARVAGRHGVDGAEQQVGVGGAEHGQHVLEGNRGAE